MNTTRFVCFWLGVATTFAGESTHTFEKGETLAIWVNTVGPYYNPQETYSFYSMPVCKPDLHGEMTYSDRWGSRLEGHDLYDSGIPLKFLASDKMTLCKFTPDQSDAKILTDAISSHYWYQMYLDDLPIWAMLGEMLSGDAERRSDNILADSEQRDPEHDHTHAQDKAYLYTHKAFSIAYNGEQIIEVNLTSEHPVPVVAHKEIQMTYSVAWTETDLPFFKRFDRYLDFKFFEHQIHWFAIFNSFMLVIFLCGLVALILMRTLKNDCARYAEDDDLELDNVVDESGWKLVHGDVFREPPHLLLFSALVGTGWQLYALASCVIGFAMLSAVYDTRGTMTTTFVVFYALTAVAAGYGSASYYKVYHQHHGVDEWKKVMFVTAILFPAVSMTILGTLNTIAITYSSSATVPFVSILGLIALWAFVDLPLLLVGTLLARKYNRAGDFPCRVNSVVRQIPDTPTYVHPISLGLFGGVLPFGAIFIEMYFVFTAFWNYKFYYVYGFMALVFIILTIVIVCVTIASTYFLLNFEDWRWQWTAFMSGGSTALFVFLYSIYYFATKTKMSGFFQTCFYFGYMGIFSFALFVLCGTIGFVGTHLFVRRLYNIKTD